MHARAHVHMPLSFLDDRVGSAAIQTQVQVERYSFDTCARGESTHADNVIHSCGFGCTSGMLNEYKGFRDSNNEPITEVRHVTTQNHTGHIAAASAHTAG